MARNVLDSTTGSVRRWTIFEESASGARSPSMRNDRAATTSVI
jgi:hypothetical protein